MDWLSVRGIVLNNLLKRELVELLLSRSENVEKPENNAIEELAEASLIMNKVLTQKTSSTKGVSSRRKGDLIKDILAIEVISLTLNCLPDSVQVRGLFGDALAKMEPELYGAENTISASQ